jgi:hypothetical protein
MKEILEKAKEGKYAVGLFNAVNVEMARAIIETAEELNSPVIVGTAEVLLPAMSLERVAEYLIPMARKAKVPVCVHFDHGLTFEKCMEAIQLGYSSIMYDCSTDTYEDNIAKVAQMVKICHAMNVTVEGELGHVGDNEGSAEGSDHQLNPSDFFTDVSLARDFVERTGVDALAHAIECYTSRKANPFSDTFALEALDLILNNIIPACDDPEAMDAKNKMQIAAFYAGIAITASGTTAVHALSYPLGGKYHIAHGVSNAILLAPVMRFNAPYCQDRLAAAYDRCCHDDVKTCQTPEEKTAWVIARLEHIVKHLEIPTSLQEFGVPAGDIDGLVEAGMQVQRLLVNNMRPVTPEDARKLYLEIL